MLLAIQDVLNWLLPILLGLFIGFMIATRKNSNVGENVVIMSPEEFSQNMRKGQLIDIRKEDSYHQAKILGSRNFPGREILGSLFKLRNDQAVFLYGDSDKGTINRVARKLVKKGYRPVYILKGGIENWPYNKK